MLINSIQSNTQQRPPAHTPVSARATEQASGLPPAVPCRNPAHHTTEPMDLDQLFALADAHQPPQYALPVRLQPFMPDLVPALGAPCTFTAPPRPDGEPDFLGLTVLDEPALVQSDPATLALRLRRQAGAASSGGSSASDAAPPLGWVADPSREAQRLDAWVEQVEALHQEDASAAALAPALPDLEALMQAWSPEMQAHIESSPLPDPRQDVDLPTFARMCCAVLDLQPPAAATTSGRASSAASEQHCALLQSLHALFALYLEFRHNPAFQHLAAFEAAAAEQPGGAVAAAGAVEGA